MEDLRAKHRKEQRDLQSQITQKKKSASKKSRKTVNDECDKLEQDLRARQETEIAHLAGEGPQHDETLDDDDLLASLAGPSEGTSDITNGIKDLSTNDESSAQDSQQKKGNRQKARLARRAAEQEAIAAEAAEEALSLPDLRKQERTKLFEEFEKLGLQEKEVAANGHCLYSSVADQMHQLHLSLRLNADQQAPIEDDAGPHSLGRDDYRVVRQAAAAYMTAHPDDFVPFLEESLEGYVTKVRDTGEWGGQLELLALAKTYGININVLQADGRIEKIQGHDKPDENIAWLAYYRHGFGLGEHYNSLRKIDGSASFK